MQNPSVKYKSIHQKQAQVTNPVHTINSIINDLQEEGFVHTFSIIKDEIGCSGPRKFYKPAEIKIVKQNDYQDNPYSSSGAIIYALETNDGYKGILINRAGIYKNDAIGRFIEKATF